MIKPTLLVHQPLRAEREADVMVQQIALERMLPFFFATGHHHYARYITHQKLMDKQSRLDHVINPVFSSWVLTACLKVAAQLLECLVAGGDEGHKRGS